MFPKKLAVARALVLAALALVFLVTAPAFAVTRPPVVKPRVPLSKKIVEAKAMHVVGYDHRPQVVYVLSRATRDYKPLVPLRKSFTDRIVRSVRSGSL